MLGAARASQYAGWWATELTSVAFNSGSTVSRVIERSTGYSYATRDVNSGSFNTNFDPDGTIDLTGLTSFTGYNYYRNTRVATYYLDSATWSAGSPGSTVRFKLTNTDVETLIYDLKAGLNGTQLRLTGNWQVQGGTIIDATLDIPSASTYYDRFITVVVSASETSGSFSSWAGGTGTAGQAALRIAAYDTLSGTLIQKTDNFAGSAALWDKQNFATKFGSTITLSGADTANTGQILGFGTGFDTDVGAGLTRYGCYWWSFGTMFDPLQATDTSWLTNAPNRQIGDAKAMVQSQFTNFDNQNPFYYNKSPAGVSAYSQATNLDWQSEPKNQAATAGLYSSTIKIRNT